jgi:hypothetical protein
VIADRDVLPQLLDPAHGLLDDCEPVEFLAKGNQRFKKIAAIVKDEQLHLRAVLPDESLDPFARPLALVGGVVLRKVVIVDGEVGLRNARFLQHLANFGRRRVGNVEPVQVRCIDPERKHGLRLREVVFELMLDEQHLPSAQRLHRLVTANDALQDPHPLQNVAVE